MREFDGEDTLVRHGERVDLDWDVQNNEFYIYNFRVPEEERGSGVGSGMMERIVQFCMQNSLQAVVAHIDLTYRTEEGYPAEKSIHVDPTLEFLRGCEFTIIDYGPQKTVLAKKLVSSSCK